MDREHMRVQLNALRRRLRLSLRIDEQWFEALNGTLDERDG